MDFNGCLMVLLLLVTFSGFQVHSGSGFGKEHLRFRRGFQSYYENYFDEIATSICTSALSEPGSNFAVRRSCEVEATCTDICTDEDLKKQAPNEAQSMQWGCHDSLNIAVNHKSLDANISRDTGKIGLSVARFFSCTIAGCGPNYCCCHSIGA